MGKLDTQNGLMAAGTSSTAAFKADHIASGRDVVALEARALQLLHEKIDESFSEAVSLILGCSQRVIVSGIGKSGHIARKVAATFAATGTPALFVHAAEASHGDVGMVSPGDVLIVFSNSGATLEIQPLCLYARSIGCKIIGISRNPTSLLARTADTSLILPKVEEACRSSMAPTTSSTMMLALGDALAVTTMRARGLSGDDIRALHPGGEIGLHLRCVGDVMHGGDRLALVTPDTSMPEVLLTMTEKRLGAAGVVKTNGELIGVITDGDLRRHGGDLMLATAEEIMTPSPRTILRSALVQDALEIMNLHRITILFVIDARTSRIPIGAVQIYDIATTTPIAFPNG
ncbi:MAG: KpsF/GutQ family sugar-phosphate isomerase [Erythrobacter sp.]